MTRPYAPTAFAGAEPVGRSSRAGLAPLSYRGGLKRVLDVALVLLALPVVLPLVLLLALLAASDGHAPFYSQIRVGRGGRSFRIWKLRSMVPQADALLAAHLAADPAARAEWDRFQKLARDPRITRVGALLRKTSLDELPQLLNVLKGDMALVGPRPMLPGQQALYPGAAYYALRPGLTGAWQVSARHTSSFEDRAAYDADYARTLSLTEDLRIIAQTLAVVLAAKGA